MPMKKKNVKSKSSPKNISPVSTASATDPAKVVKAALKAGADEARVELVDSDVSQVRFAQNEVTVANSRVARNLSIFLNVGKKLVSAEIDDLTQTKETIRYLLALAKAMKPNTEYAGLAQGKFRYRKSKVSPDLKSAAGTLVDLAGRALDAALSEGAERVAGTIQCELGRVRLATSSGVEAAASQGSIQLSLRAFCDDLATGHAVSVATNLKALGPETAGTRAGTLAVLSKKLPRRKIEPAKYDVVFDRLAYADLAAMIGRSASAFNVDAGFSPFREKVGQQVASGILDVWDDGVREDGIGSAPFDDEGVPSQKTQLIRKGVLEGLLHNTTTASRHKGKTTGNAGIIAPHPWNVVVATGKGGPEDLWKEMGRGIYVSNVWYTRFQDYVGGDFSTIPRDALLVIENGEPVAATSGLRVTDNLLGILKRTERLGGDTQQIKWWEVPNPTFTPSALVRQVNVTKSTS